MNIINILDQVKKEVGMSSEIELYRIEDRYLYDDGYIVIMASDKENMESRASYHKSLVAIIYQLLKLDSTHNKYKPKVEYDTAIAESLKLCHREPKIDIFFSKKYKNLSVVAYTDDINMIIQENNILRGVAS